jgi:hypothetical protein
MRTKFFMTGVFGAFLIGALASGSGCNSGGNCAEADCQIGEQLYSCKPSTGLKQYSCLGGEAAANSWCQGIAGKNAVHIPCDEYGDGGTDETGGAPSYWDPSANVTYDPASGHYLVDESFVDLLKGNTGLLLNDSARVALSPTGGYFVLESVAQGDLADVMGLQSGDVLISVNRYGLQNLDAIVDAWYALENSSSFQLTISRNSQTMHLHYDIVQ